MMQMTHKYAEGKGGDIEGTGSNGEELQMYVFTDFLHGVSIPVFAS